MAAGDLQREDARAALALLCETYWYPLYAYVRRRGYPADDAQDLTQAFFARLLEKHAFQVADPQRGKFRSFLLAAMDHFLANERDRARAQKRSSGRPVLSLDLPSAESRMIHEPTHNLTPQRLYERQWALTLLTVVIGRLESEHQASGKARQFDLLRQALTGDRNRLPYAEIAAQLEMTVEGARQAVHRLRKQYRAFLREEVARTVGTPDCVDEELASLFEALAN